MADYLGRPLLDLLPDRPDNRQERVERLGEDVVIPASGAVYADPFVDEARSTHTLTFSGKTHAEVALIEAWFLARLGRYESFWFPSGQHDLTLLSASASDFVVRAEGYGALLFPEPAWKDLVATVVRGGAWTMIPMRAVATRLVSGSREQISTIARTEADVPPADNEADVAVGILSRLCYGRLADDALTTLWEAHGFATVTVSLLELPAERPL